MLEHYLLSSTAPIFGGVFADSEITRTMDSSTRTCGNCKKEAGAGTALRPCSQCKQVRYCGQECQMHHWKIHKTECKKVAPACINVTPSHSKDSTIVAASSEASVAVDDILDGAFDELARTKTTKFKVAASTPLTASNPATISPKSLSTGATLGVSNQITHLMTPSQKAVSIGADVAMSNPTLLHTKPTHSLQTAAQNEKSDRTKPSTPTTPARKSVSAGATFRDSFDEPPPLFMISLPSRFSEYWTAQTQVGEAVASSVEVGEALELLMSIEKRVLSGKASWSTVRGTAEFGSAEKRLKDASARQEPFALFLLGMIYKGELWQKNKKVSKALTYLGDSASIGYVPAMFQLGVLHVQGKNTNEALKWLERAAVKGHSGAQTGLGQLYLAGAFGVPMDLGASFYWLHLALENGDAANAGTALSRLGHVYQRTGGLIHASKILKCHTLAANAGISLSQFELAQFYNGALGFQENLPLAFDWALKAATAGLVVAQAFLSQMYEYGRGTAVDIGAALTWCKKAADTGDPAALHNFGRFHFLGIGVPRSPSTAFKYFSSGAEKGNEHSHLTLGQMYLHGDGVVSLHLL